MPTLKKGEITQEPYDQKELLGRLLKWREECRVHNDCSRCFPGSEDIPLRRGEYSELRCYNIAIQIFRLIESAQRQGYGEAKLLDEKKSTPTHKLARIIRERGEKNV